MGSNDYSFLDIVVLDEVRGRFASGEALVILAGDLGEVLWANGPGARYFGFDSIDAIIGAAPGLGLPAERQISSTAGFPDIGRDRAIAIRLARGFGSQVVNISASGVTMPDGEKAILLAIPAADTGSAEAVTAERAIEGFGDDGSFTALIDGEGRIVAASPGFASLGVGGPTLQQFILEARGPERLAKKRIPVGGRNMPAGLARLTDDPAMHLMVVVDDGEVEAEMSPVPAGAEMPSGQAALSTEEHARGRPDASIDRQTDGKPQATRSTHGSVDRWYFHHEDETRHGSKTAPIAEQDNLPAPVAASSSGARHKFEAGAAPVKFVWRTGADGRFASISEEFAAALGEASADIVGRAFREVATAFGFDPDGEIAGLLERRDTWSGRSVLWPVIGSDMLVPVDLAALPVYGRDRNFQGFRGFGVARMGDAVPKPEPVSPPAGEMGADVGHRVADAAEVGSAESVTQQPASDTPPKHDPFKGEVPALVIVPKPERRHSDKIIRLAEHRPGAPSEELSQTERNAFREIGARLKKDSEKRGDAAKSRDEANAAGDAEAEKVLPIVRETFGKRDWLKMSPSEKTRSEGASEAPAEARRLLSGEDGTDTAASADTGSDIATEDMPGAVAGDDTPVRPEAVEEPVADLEDTGVAEDASPGPAPTEETLPSAAPEGAVPSGVGSADPDLPSLAPDEAPAQPDLYQTLLSRLPTPVLVHSGDDLHYANDEFLHLTGYPSLEAIRDAGGLGELFADPYEAEDETGDRKLCLKTASGETVPVQALLQSVPWKGGKSLMLALRPAARTLETQSQAEIHPLPAAETIAEAEAGLEELRAIIDTATDGVVLISPEGTIRSISRPAEALFGFDSHEVAGKPFAALFAIESQRAAQDYLQGLSDNGVASVLNDGREVIGREAQGRFIPLFMTIGRLPGSSGFCAVLRDVTQWKRAEEELTQARAQAELASSQKTEFLARVSHEIRTPLNAIIGFSELMIDEKFGAIGNDRYRDYLRDINRSGNHVLDLVNDLLDISKIEAGQQEMNYEAVSLNDTLAETVALMQPQANRERVIIRSSFPSRLPEVVADLRSVRQIALNLLSNAIRYTQAGGQVIVSTSYETSGDIVMRVRDTGVGMSQAEIEQAMKPFKQVNALKRPRGDGTGLGLPLTKAMVEANRARFSISSAPGDGTLVEVTFPSTRVLAD